MSGECQSVSIGKQKRVDQLPSSRNKDAQSSFSPAQIAPPTRFPPAQSHCSPPALGPGGRWLLRPLCRSGSAAIESARRGGRRAEEERFELRHEAADDRLRLSEFSFRQRSRADIQCPSTRVKLLLAPEAAPAGFCWSTSTLRCACHEAVAALRSAAIRLPLLVELAEESGDRFPLLGDPAAVDAARTPPCSIARDFRPSSRAP